MKLSAPCKAFDEAAFSWLSACDLPRGHEGSHSWQRRVAAALLTTMREENERLHSNLVDMGNDYQRAVFELEEIKKREALSFLGWWCKRMVPFAPGDPDNHRADGFHTDPLEGCPGPHVPCWGQDFFWDDAKLDAALARQREVLEANARAQARHDGDQEGRDEE